MTNEDNDQIARRFIEDEISRRRQENEENIGRIITELISQVAKTSQLKQLPIDYAGMIIDVRKNEKPIDPNEAVKTFLGAPAGFLSMCRDAGLTQPATVGAFVEMLTELERTLRLMVPFSPTNKPPVQTVHLKAADILGGALAVLPSSE